MLHRPLVPPLRTAVAVLLLLVGSAAVARAESGSADLAALVARLTPHAVEVRLYGAPTVELVEVKQGSDTVDALRVSGDGTAPAGVFIHFRVPPRHAATVNVAAEGTKTNYRLRVNELEPTYHSLTTGTLRMDGTAGEFVELLVYGDGAFETTITSLDLETTPARGALQVGDLPRWPRTPLFEQDSSRLRNVREGLRGRALTGAHGIAIFGGPSYGTYPVGRADDDGLFIVALAISEWTRLDARDALVVAVTVLLLGSLVIAAWGLRRPDLPTVAWVITLIPLVILLSVVCADRGAYPAHVVAPLVLLPWFWRWFLAARPERPVAAVAGIAALGAAIVAGNLVRLHSGTAIAIGVAAALLFDRRFSVRARVGLLGVFLAGVLVATGAMSTARAARDRTLDEVRTIATAETDEASEDHPFWHAIYGGLGYEENPYGIAFDDTVIYDHARALDPDAAYLSLEYERALRDRYIEIVRENPGFVIRTYLAKAWATLHSSEWNVTFLLVGVAGLLADRRRWPIDVAFALALLGAMAPGVLGDPTRFFINSFVATPAVYAAVGLGRVIRTALRLLRSRSTQPVATPDSEPTTP